MKWRMVILLVVASLSGGCSPRALTLLFLPVGYGDAIVGIPSGGEAFLIDGGPPEAWPILSGALKARGLEGLGLVFCTHFHPDHDGGLVKVLDAVPVGTLLLNEDPRLFTGESALARKVVEQAVPFRLVSRGDRLTAGDRVTITVLSPSKTLKGDLNTRSMVLRVQVDGVSILLEADADDAAEREMLRAYPQGLESAVIKVPHHGWGSGSLPAFLSAVGPELAILSVGPSRWPAPDPAILARYATAGIPILRTDQDGLITLDTNGRKVLVRTGSGKRVILRKGRNALQEGRRGEQRPTPAPAG